MAQKGMKEAKDVIAECTPKDSVLKQIVGLYEMPMAVLKERFLALYPNSSATPNKTFLIHRIAYKLQEEAFGGLSAQAQERLHQLKTELNPIENLGKNRNRNNMAKAARRLPMPGTVITKTFKGKQLEVKVLEKGFEYNGKPYPSLSRIAKEITGVHQSGYVFFKV